MSNGRKIYFTLRIAMAMCFIGHGAFGIITKEIWCNYFGVFGIGTGLSYQLMPVVGFIDIALGIAVLLYPMRIVAAWLVVWGLFTAMLRPLSGEPFAEFIERAGNYGAPLAMLILTGSALSNVKNLFEPMLPGKDADAMRMKYVALCLRVSVFLLLAGHGWLNLMEKKTLIDQYSAIGFSQPVYVAKVIGIFEIAAAFFSLSGIFPGLLFVIFIWKVLSETFYPAYPLFEWIERGGSYGCILALWFVSKKNNIKEYFDPGILFNLLRTSKNS